MEGFPWIGHVFGNYTFDRTKYTWALMPFFRCEDWYNEMHEQL